MTVIEIDARKDGDEQRAVQPTSTLAEQQARAERGFFVHAAAFMIVMTLLAMINLTRTRDHWWFLWPLVGWGAGLVGHGIRAFALRRGTAGPYLNA